ncbi:hypothetical protein [Psychromonas sp. Urea-02u-13]|uniref:hypothetical protein n=1 Tax=Psychromonas sp. Urea-02u-13 TaxID=2058326 RepID=UPI000C34F193|nr:hypothetical protein [Psychromonas sp. Urea-02u-13]PKG40541.1 hypothetical protein CXF74_02825 [Psychromonas sp. Urea-02u-13]
MQENTSKKKSDFKRVIVGFIVVATAPFLYVYYLFLSHFNGAVSNEQGDWGAIGSFVGGTLGPVYAFLALLALLYTIYLQLEELRLTREELQATKEELKRSATAQEASQESMKLQSQLMQKQGDIVKQQQFESTFFNLLSVSERRLQNLTISRTDQRDSDIGTLCTYSFHNSPDILHTLDNLERLKANERCYEALIESTSIVSEVLNFIRNSHYNVEHDLLSINEARYASILKSTFPGGYLEMLYISTELEEDTELKNLISRYSYFDDNRLKIPALLDP